MTTVTFTASTTWTAPAGVTSVTAQCWGGGGGGAEASNGGQSGGGGGGGEFAQDTVAVTPGSSYVLTVGAAGAGGSGSEISGSGANGSPGGNSSFAGDVATVTAHGGGGGGLNSGAGNGPAGSAGSGSTNSVHFSGGAGGLGNGGTRHFGGGGGASGGAAAAGTAGSSGSAGGGGGLAVAGGGPGGAGGGSNQAGGSPSAGPGGGGGASFTSSKDGGAGVAGQVTLTYTAVIPVTNPALTIPGPPPSVLTAVLRTSPANPGAPARRATFTTYPNPPRLPSLMTDVVFMPQYAFLDANVEVSGNLTVDGQITGTGASNPMTSPGDMIVGGTAGISTRLPFGSAGQTLTTSTSGVGWAAAPVDWFNAETGYGAVGDGVTDNTTALTNWINAINAGAGVNVAGGYLPGGNYLVAGLLPSITANGVIITGDGWAQTASTAGSVITASNAAASPLITVAGEGVKFENLTLNGSNKSTTVVAVTGQHCILRDMQIRAPATSGICLDVRTGGKSIWIDTCVVNGINSGNTGIQLNDTDAVIVNSKPQNSANCIVLLSASSGALIAGNHFTPGSGFGVNCIYFNGNPSHIGITGNRFDNTVQSPIQISPGAATSTNIAITGNVFHATTLTSNTYAQIAVDTSGNGGVYGLAITGNAGYGSAGNLAAYALAAQTQAGGVAANAGNISSFGTNCTGNTFWVGTSFFGTGATPTIDVGNMVSTNGTSWSAA